jgi:hypothetical protein
VASDIAVLQADAANVIHRSPDALLFKPGVDRTGETALQQAARLQIFLAVLEEYHTRPLHTATVEVGA